MPVLALEQPKNEPKIDYYGNTERWDGLVKEIETIRRRANKVPLVIDGHEMTTKQTFDSINPSDGSVIAKAYKADESDVQLAVKTALKRKEGWASLDPNTRILLMRDLEKIVSERSDKIIATAMLEGSFTAPEVEKERIEILDFFRFHPYWYNGILQERPTAGYGETNWQVARPLQGFTVAISPFNFAEAIGWNLPTVMALTGNTVVWKPSSDMPLTSYLLMRYIKDAGWPDGVINMVLCPGEDFAKVALIHPELSAVNFTGGYETVWKIKQLINSKPRQYFVREVMETGGKDWMWVDKSAGRWLEYVVGDMINGAFEKQGQKCSALSRAYVASELFSDLKAALKDKLTSVKVGDPTKERVGMGAVINNEARKKIIKYIEMARKDSDCEIIFGGDYSKESFYIQPTVILTKNRRHRLMQEEIFGPVLTISAFSDNDEEDAIKALREVRYKLTGAVWCKEPTKFESLRKAFGREAGNLYFNRSPTGALVAQQPFGGDGISGTNCKAGGAYYLLNFISWQSVTYRHTPAPKR